MLINGMQKADFAFIKITGGIVVERNDFMTLFSLFLIFITFCFPLGLVTLRQQILGTIYCACIQRLKKNLFGFTCAIPGTKMIPREI